MANYNSILSETDALVSSTNVRQEHASGSRDHLQNQDQHLEGDLQENKLHNQRIKFPLKSLVLENKGSVARDHLANERTFLAWLRTSLSFITIGVGITQLFRIEAARSSNLTLKGLTLFLSNDSDEAINHFGKPLGVTFIILGICTLIYGSLKFFRVQWFLTQNKYPVSRIGLGLLIAAVIVAVLITLYMVLQADT